ncbi:MAG: TlpA disulfide reductase family protein [Chitinophagaceae bacterium]
MKKAWVIIISLFTSCVLTAQEVKKVKITDLEKTIAESKTPLIVNFWATWCMPCVEEIPYFQEEVKKHAKDSVKLLLVSLDFREEYDQIAPFLKKRKFTAPVVWLNETKADYFCPKVDAKWSGAIPASLFINNKKKYRKFFEEKLLQEKLKKEIMAML